MGDQNRQKTIRGQIAHHPNGLVRQGLVFSGVNCFDMFGPGHMGSVWVAEETLNALESSPTPWEIQEECLDLQRHRNRLVEIFGAENAFKVQLYYRTPENAETLTTMPDIIGYYPPNQTYVMKNYTMRKVAELS